MLKFDKLKLVTSADNIEVLNGFEVSTQNN